MGSASYEGGNVMQRVRDAHGLVANFAEELIRMESDEKDAFWSGSDFYDLTAMFLASLKATGFEIEHDSFGSRLAQAIREDDGFGMSRFRFELMSNIRKLHGGKRSGYMFFVFWPRLHAALVAEEY